MRILRTLLAVICISLVASVASATTVVIPNIFSNGQVIDATMMNANFSALANWANGNVDNTNIGSGGIFASQIIPGSTAQATFGGATSYTFPTVLNLLGGAVVTGPASFSTLAANSPAVCTDSSRNLTTSGCGGGVTLYASQIIPTTTPQATFGGSVGYVFQDFNLLAGLTAVENVSLPLELDGVSMKKARAQGMAALEGLGLADRAENYPDQLSGGERQRGGAAGARHHERSRRFRGLGHGVQLPDRGDQYSDEL